MNADTANKLSKRGGKRWLDLPTELRIRLHKTLKLHSGESFFHEQDSPQEERIVSATLSKDGKLLDVVLWVNRI